MILYQRNLEEQIVEVLQDKPQEISLRYTRPLLSLDNNGDLNVFMTILPRPPVMEMFSYAKDIYLSVDPIQIYRNLTTVEECATMCIENTNCLSFDWATGSSGDYNHNSCFKDLVRGYLLMFLLGCYLNPEHYTNSTIIPSSLSFLHYSSIYVFIYTYIND